MIIAQRSERKTTKIRFKEGVRVFQPDRVMRVLPLFYLIETINQSINTSTMKVLFLSSLLFLLVPMAAEARMRSPTTTTSFLPRGRLDRPRPSSIASAAAADVVNAIPRGGGAPFDAALAQKLFVSIYGLNAVLCGVDPALAQKAYGLPASDASKRLMSTVGSVGMTHSLLLFLQVFQGMSFEKAIGWSVWPYVLSCFNQSFISKTDRFIDFPSKNHLTSVSLNLLVFLASQMKDAPSWAGSLNRFYGFWSVLNSAGFLLAPEATAKAYGVSLKNIQCTFLMQNTGIFLLAHGITVLYGSSLSEGIGWSAAAIAVCLVGLVVTGKSNEAGIPTARYVASCVPWVLLLAAIYNRLLGST